MNMPSSSFEKKFPYKILASLFATTFLVDSFVHMAIYIFNLTFIENNLLVTNFIVASLVSLFSYYIFIRSRLKKISKDTSFFQQQLTGLNEVAIISASDTAGNITFVNDNFCRISGHPRSEIIGKNHRIVKSDYHEKEFYQAMWKTIKSGQIWKGQIKNRSKSGEDFWVYSNIIPIKNLSTGRIEEFIAIRFDITNEKKLELELELEQSKGVHLARLAAIGEMAGSVAHEINNPTAVILGKIHILKRTLEKMEEKELQESILSKLYSIEEHSIRISKIVKGLREFSHGGAENTYETINSHTLLDSVLELCEEKIKMKSITLHVDCDNFDFSTTRLPLEQVLVNLINNSVDAIALNDEKWIQISVKENGHFINISITDSGNGIAPEIVLKIMLPFFTTKPIGQGTGLGLSISKGLIEKLGGSLTYDNSSPNTCFKIAMPKDEMSIFATLPFSKVIDYLDQVRQKFEQWQKLDSSDKFKGEFTLKIAECPLPAWMSRYESRLSKSSDFLAIKNSYELLRISMSEIEWKYTNRNLADESEVLKLKIQLNENLERLVKTLIEVESHQSGLIMDISKAA